MLKATSFCETDSWRQYRITSNKCYNLTWWIRQRQPYFHSLRTLVWNGKLQLAVLIAMHGPPFPSRLNQVMCCHIKWLQQGNWNGPAKFLLPLRLPAEHIKSKGFQERSVFIFVCFYLSVSTEQIRLHVKEGWGGGRGDLEYWGEEHNSWRAEWQMVSLFMQPHSSPCTPTCI